METAVAKYNSKATKENLMEKHNKLNYTSNFTLFCFIQLFGITSNRPKVHQNPPGPEIQSRLKSGENPKFFMHHHAQLSAARSA
jgi:hypothetical protein